MDIPHFIFSFDGHLCYQYFLAILNSATLSVQVPVMFSSSSSSSSSLILLFFKFIYSCILYIWVLCIPAHQKKETNPITYGCEPSGGFWELNTGLLEEQSSISNR